MDRRSLFRLIGFAAGSAAMYRAMFQLGYAAESGYSGPIKLEGNPHGASVLILGAGLAGMTAALELRNAGYKVQVLEYNNRAGGRNWTLHGGDTYTELGGFTQHVEFEKGLYFNPGPWRLPYHHHAILGYCKRLNVALEPFIQVNYNAYVHSPKAFDGKPKRFREVHADFQGGVAELLAKCTKQGALDQAVTREDREVLLEAMREWGALDGSYRYTKGLLASRVRGYEVDPGGGLDSVPVPSDPMAMNDLLRSQMWRALGEGQQYYYQDTLFEPVGGMGMIGKAFARELGPLIHYNAKVTEIHQDHSGVTVTYEDTRTGGPRANARADWCVCTIPLSILDQISVNVGAPMLSAIDAISYFAAAKVGLQFKRRFWEQDDHIYGGISYTDQTIGLIGYPCTGYFGSGKSVLLGAYTFGPHAFELTAMSPEQRIRLAVQQGSRIHPQYPSEFENGVAVGWHRVPWTLGCFAKWTEEQRARYYDNLCVIDGRIVLAGEHCSRLPAWQEGAILSALDAIKRLHQRVLSGVA
ncbi:MAG: flavin monoamine oxidase family protein [Steroidobacteraceae bacterium]